MIKNIVRGGILLLSSVLIVGCVHLGQPQLNVPSVEQSLIQDKKKVPRGIRNNNPGNIIKTDTKWQGEVECEDTRFECFKDARYGIRAAGIILNTYWTKYSARSVSDFIYRWAPPHDNNPTRGYTEFVSARIQERKGGWHIDGIGRTVLTSRSLLPDLLAAIIEFENGYNPYKMKDIKEVFDGLSIRNNHNARISSDWRSTKAVGNEAAPATAAMDSYFTGIVRAARSVGISQKDRQQRDAVYKTYNCPISDLCNYRMAFGRSTLVPWYSGDARMDRDRSGLLVLYGRQTDNGMEDSHWPSDNSPTHPPNGRDQWAVFRRLAGWA